MDETNRPQIRLPNLKKQKDDETAVVKHNKLPKITYLYVRIDLMVSESFDLQSFLMERMQRRQEMKFEIVDEERKEKKNFTLITLKFKSRRLGQMAQHLLKISNRDSQVKIDSSFDPAELDGSKQSDKNDAIFREQVQGFLHRAEIAIRKHEQKMKSTSDKIEKLKTTKFVAIDEFERTKFEKLALEDKLVELTLQFYEFKKFIKSLTATLDQCWKNKTYEKKIDEIRKLFGVECCRLDSALPMYARRSEIVKIVKENQVCVILGETGSGKSTQMTQYLHQVGFANDGIIVCTQPRKVAAISLATRVASEMATNVGQLVGYRVGMRSKVCGNTKILYTTDHALLNECLRDTTFSKYSCVIIDEAHERSIYTDLLLGMIKRLLDVRPDFRVLITSATIDPDVFVRYFNGCPVLKVSGRMFPVEVIWHPSEAEGDVFENYQSAAVQKALDIHKRMPEGDVLVFLTTPLETEKCCDEFRQIMKNDNSFQCLVLHGQVQAEEQQLVFQPTPPTQRKIVFATNSAETSITIPGIKYVVDTGLAKEKRYDPKRNMSSLSVVMISRSSAEQRKGRAGRTGPGLCYRLYTEDHHQSMDATSLPEILKVHLGHAMLKLAELGINPLKYDFVQSPGKPAIEGAMKMLEDIGAIRDETITETGKWLAKLPIEPRLGSIIAKGKERCLLYESVVLSTVSGVGSFIFYRGSTDVDKKKSESQKIHFCHNSGDSMSLLNVFREWNEQPEKKKNEWCVEHSINSRAIRNARETVNEICIVLQKELGLTVNHCFGDPSNTDAILQSILFQCFSSNICHFMGHERAGYYAARLDQIVHIHPSSVLNALGLLPQWVVFEQVLKTSKDFVTGLTPVEDSVVHEAAENGTLRYDIEVMKSKQMYLLHTEYVGSKAFWRIVGPAFSRLKVFQDAACRLAAPSFAVIQADKEKGELKLFASKQKSSALVDLLKPDIVVVQDELQNEDCEHPLSQTQGPPKQCSVSVVIGAGGTVTEVLMPDEYRTVFIENADESTTEATIRQKLGQFGVIKECKVFNNRRSQKWGCVKFEKSDMAKLAVAATQDDQRDMAVAEHKRRGGRESMTFSAKLTWCRRPTKEHAFVHLAPEELPRILSSSFLKIGETFVKISLDKKTRSDLFLKWLSRNTTEDDIRAAILKELGPETNPDVITKIVIPRYDVNTTSKDLNTFKTNITAAISEYAPSGQFDVTMLTPNPKSVSYVAYANFHHLNECQNACNRLSRNLSIKDVNVLVEPHFSTQIFVSDKVWNLIEQDLKTSTDYVRQVEAKTAVTTRQLKSGHHVVDIHSCEAQEMARVRSVLDAIVKGDVLECKSNPNLKQLFTKNGRQFLAEMEKRHACLVLVDDRTMTVSIIGRSEICTQVRCSIYDFLDTFLAGECKDIYLKGPLLPAGVMKVLTTQYGSDLEKLKKDVGLVFIELNHYKHKILLRGSFDAIRKTETIIERITAELKDNLSVKLQAEERPACVVCFEPVEDGQLYRLEACGHPYCRDCIEFQLQAALTNKEFPIVCAQEECSFQFMWRDLSKFIKNGSVSLKKLVESSASAFVSGNQKDYRYCITADCSQIYRTSIDGTVFACCDCQVKICTSCHTQHHEGLTCAMYESEKDGGSAMFRQWLEENKNTKLCPHCQTPIEKIEGCNKMTCTACRKVFCWLCRAPFDSEDECYDHLRQNHGGCF